MKRIAVLCLAALALAGCAEGHAIGIPIHGPICPAFTIPMPQLVSPLAGAAGVADGNFTLTVTYSGSIALFSPPLILPDIGSPPGELEAQGGPLTQISPTQWTSTVGPLSPHNTYFVQFTANAGTDCPQTNLIGKFTTV